MKTIFFEINDEEANVMKENLKDSDLVFYNERLTIDNVKLAESADSISVFVNSEVTKDVIDSIPNLKFITTRSTGFDHIDTVYAKSKGIVVSNVPAYGSVTVAEFTFALLLNISRKISEANARLRNGINYDISNLEGFDLYGKTLGVIGTGKIGKNVVRIAKGFGMKIVAFDAFPDLNFAKENGFEYFTLQDVLSKSDIVTLHTPYNKDTHHLINSETIKFFKKGITLINTARGEIVDTDVLIKALKDGTIAYAGLDVLEEERKLKEKIGESQVLSEDKELINMPNVLVTPHIAFSSKEAHHEILRVTYQNILDFISNSPKNLV